MARLFTITEGWTLRLDPFTLSVNGSVYDLTGITVTARWRDRNGDLVDFTGSTITKDPDQVGAGKGKIYLDPGPNLFNAALQPYTVKWKLVDGASKVVFCPSGDPDTIEIVKG